MNQSGLTPVNLTTLPHWLERRGRKNPYHRRRLLRARRERPRCRRAAECSQQFPPSDGDCHTPLPCEVRKGTIARRESAVPNRAAPGAGEAG